MGGVIDFAALLDRCTFPPPGTTTVCGFSGGADSTALLVLALEAGCLVTAVHVHHGLRPSADHDERLARSTAGRLGVAFDVVHATVEPGANLEARARAARHAALGPDAMLGHTADDQAETLLLALLRGSGATGLGAIDPGPRHPILALRSCETRALCDHLGFEVANDPTNGDVRFRRNRIRHDLMPLLDDIAERDVTVLLGRTAALLRDDDRLLARLAESIDPTRVEELLAAPRPLAARAVRGWLALDGYPPTAAAVARVLEVAAGGATACELTGGIRVERRGGRLLRVPTDPLSG